MVFTPFTTNPRSKHSRAAIAGARRRTRAGPRHRPRHQPPRPRSARRRSFVAQLLEALLVDPEVVRQLMEDGDLDLALELLRVGKRLLEGQAIDRDLGRQVGRLLEEAEEVGILRVLVLDDHGDVVETAREVGRQRVESTAHVLVERRGHQYAGRRGGRRRTRSTVSAPKTNPPTWAKNAVPPPDSGCFSARPPSTI